MPRWEALVRQLQGTALDWPQAGRVLQLLPEPARQLSAGLPLGSPGDSGTVWDLGQMRWQQTLHASSKAALPTQP